MFNFIGAFTNVGISWLRCVFFKRSLFFGEWSICILHSIRTERDFSPILCNDIKAARSERGCWCKVRL